jgi:tetratricopeptide (TPR) repeat protein
MTTRPSNPQRPFSRALIGLCVAASLVAPLRAQDEPDAPERRAYDAWEEALEEGRDRVVLDLAVARLKANEADVGTWEAVARAAENVGLRPRADEAAARWLKLAPASKAARTFVIRQLRRRGDLDGAVALAAPWIKPVSPAPDDAPAFDLASAAEAARCCEERGDDAEAARRFDLVIEEAQRVVVKDPYDLLGLAEAYLFVGGRQGVDLADETLLEATEKLAAAGTLARDPYPLIRHAQLDWERKFLPGDAVKKLDRAVKLRPNETDALWYRSVVLREWTNSTDNYKRSEESLAWCLDVRPDHAGGRAERAQRALEDMRLDEARKGLETALAAEPRHRPCRALLAAAAYLSGDRAGADQKFAELLKLDPTFGEGRRLLAEVLNERRRWPEALEQAKKAAEIDPRSSRNWDDVARYALFLAQTPIGLSALEKANELDAYNWPWRRNMELVLGTMKDRYVAVETERFLVRVPENERDLLRRFYGPFFDRSFDLLTAKYGYVPDGSQEARGRVTVEMFDDSSDFGARTFGYVYPGFLGVCFGPLVTLNGPRAMPAAQNSWARTFHHEFAHSITVGLAQGRMPRWLTEGLSTYEEIAFEPSWTRGMDRALFDAWATDDLCRTGDFDVHFRGPRVIFAYFQAGLVAETMVRLYGMPKIAALLRAYAEDLTTDAAFKKALGVAPEEVDRIFREETGRRFAAYRLQPRYTPVQREALEAARRRDPQNRENLIRLAAARARMGAKVDAESAIAEARRAGGDDPRLKLLEATMALNAGNVARAEELRAELETAGVEDYDLALGLGQAALKAKKADVAEARFREAVAAFPTVSGDDGPSPRVLLVKLLRDAGRTDDAMAVAEEHLRYRSEDLQLRKDLIAWRLGRGEKEAALKLLDLHVLIDARDAGVHLDRGRLQFEAGRFRDALLSADLASDALRFKPNDKRENAPETPVARAAARILAARALARLGGRLEEARGALDAARRASPEHPELVDAEREIEEAAASRPTGADEEKGKDR